MALLDPDPSEHPECQYCSGFLSPDAAEKDLLWNKVILESKNFVVVPTVGHLIRGWLLVIARKHYICMGALEETVLPELLAIKTEAELLLKRLYGPVIKFEHGPCASVRAGACVDHAHLHLVPTGVDLGEGFSSRFPGRQLRDLQELWAQHRRGPYLFYEDTSGLATLYEIPVIPSQYVRMLLADRVGSPERYDWHKYRGEKELRAFLHDLETR